MKFLLMTVALLVFAGCEKARIADVTGVLDMSARDIDPQGPPDAEPGACYGKEIAPAVIETTTEQILVRAPGYGDDGTLVRPATYRTKTRQDIVAARRDVWFKMPCEGQKVDAFNASLQRALKARGYYVGPVSGIMDPLTRAAIRRYQRDRGLDSAKLSLQSARELGLVAMPRQT
ncbi:MAG: peptidoglycan-binding protein [Paracoccaceae bacterium]